MTGIHNPRPAQRQERQGLSIRPALESPYQSDCDAGEHWYPPA